ncbi:hypothetical protein KQX54_007748 [Cotesia glomerata]|uniref:Uncharacterized protein n=1 Tax=Cotesia glomerata TaxID=32391 RepID=A0AAV7IPZ8_COTGL|nr:hypothetical protein KQX54_007748 [Cotesia glomerata]
METKVMQVQPYALISRIDALENYSVCRTKKICFLKDKKYHPIRESPASNRKLYVEENGKFVQIKISKFAETEKELLSIVTRKRIIIKAKKTHSPKENKSKKAKIKEQLGNEKQSAISEKELLKKTSASEADLDSPLQSQSTLRNSHCSHAKPRS